jgi:hypothetical protein
MTICQILCSLGTFFPGLVPIMYQEKSGNPGRHLSILSLFAPTFFSHLFHFAKHNFIHMYIYVCIYNLGMYIGT